MAKLTILGKIVVVIGYTATGKTSLAINLARQFKGEIINADSRQVYRGLDIGSGKDLSQYSNGGEKISYHLIDIYEPDKSFNLFDFKNKVIEAIDDIIKRGKLAIICGGSGLYIDALLNDYQFSGKEINPNFQKKYLKYSFSQLKKYFQKKYSSYVGNFDLSQSCRIIRAIEIIESGDKNKRIHSFQGQYLVLMPFYRKDIVYERIRKRLVKRWDLIIKEIFQLKENGLISSKRLHSLGLEYRYINDLIEGRMNKQECFDGLYKAIRKFAKRQGTWFRKFEKRGIVIHRLICKDDAINLVSSFLS